MKKIALVIPALASGGSERVMSELAKYFVKQQDISVYLIILTKGEKFYSIPDEINLIEPTFDHKKFSRLIFTLKIFKFLRASLRDIKPNAILSFGGKYNAFVLLSSLGLGIRTYISDRSRPGISYGCFLDFINSKVYRLAAGIIAQTQLAKDIISKKIQHKNIKVIGNPIRKFQFQDRPKQNIILNVGRFIPSKQQALLLNIFSKINPDNWKLVFLGDGESLLSVKKLAKNLKVLPQVEFLGNVKNTDDYYSAAKIYAFTSISEGFPNALGEAMSAGVACISFDCEAGPSDLIDDGINGFLIKKNDDVDYQRKLSLLIKNKEIRVDFGKMAKEKLNKYDITNIGEQFLNFMLIK